jgi:hypothetical protein
MATFTEAPTGTFVNDGFANGTATVTAGPQSIKVKGPFSIITDRIDDNEIIGRGFWMGTNMSGPDAGHKEWTNLKLYSAYPANGNPGFTNIQFGYGAEQGYTDLAAEIKNRKQVPSSCPSTPEVNFAGTVAGLSPTVGPVTTSCAGEDDPSPTAYNQTVGTWQGPATANPTTPVPDVLLGGSMTLDATFIEAAEGGLAGIGVAFGNIILPVTKQVTVRGRFWAATQRIDVGVIGRGFWKAKINGGDDSDHLVWSNFDFFLADKGSTIALELGDPHTYGYTDFSAEYNLQTCAG